MRPLFQVNLCECVKAHSRARLGARTLGQTLNESTKMGMILLDGGQTDNKESDTDGADYEPTIASQIADNTCF